MKHLKFFKTFESSYNKEDYYEFLAKELSKYNITPLKVKDILGKLEEEIQKRIEIGEDPRVLLGQLISDLELTSDRGSMAVRHDTPWTTPSINYL